MNVFLFSPQRVLLFFLVFFLAIMLLVPSCAPKIQMVQIKTGDDAYVFKRYMLAAQLYEKEFNRLVKGSEQKRDIAFRIAECYRMANRVEEAAKWYKQALDLNYEPIAIYYYADMLKRQEKYEAALEEFQKYQKAVPRDAARVKKAIEGCELALKWKATEPGVEVVNMEHLNSTAADYAPVFFEDSALVFSSQRRESVGEEIYEWTGEEYSSLFIARRNAQGEYETPVLFDKTGIINTSMHEGTIYFDHRMNAMYFTRCGNPDNPYDDYCKIYVSSRIGKELWSTPEVIPFFGDSVNVGHPFLSPSGKQLYFSADAPGGYGGKDLYVSYRTKKGWGEPINLGSQINTEGDEVFPYVSPSGTLYFSSNGHVGMGGLDIFYVVQKDKYWEVINMGHPINSGGDDFGIIFIKMPVSDVSIGGTTISSGYFASSRPGGKGNDDIYMFRALQEVPSVIVLSGTVYGKLLENPYDRFSRVKDTIILGDARVELFIQTNVATPLQTDATDILGMFKFTLNSNMQYTVRASHPEFLPASEAISTMGLKGVHQLQMAFVLEPKVLPKTEVMVKSEVREDIEVKKIPQVEKVEVRETEVSEKVEKKIEKKIEEIAITETDRVRVDEEIIIPHIYYDFDRWDIRSDAAVALDSVLPFFLDVLRKYPGLHIEIGSHTDARGSESYNMSLSQKRAESVMNYLVARGIDSKRISARGYGESKLLNPCTDTVTCSEEEHQRNRRTTFRLSADGFYLESIEPPTIVVGYPVPATTTTPTTVVATPTPAASVSPVPAENAFVSMQLVYRELLKKYGAKELDGLEFRVQIGAFSRVLPETHFDYLGVQTDVEVYELPNRRLYRYLVSERFSKVEDAEKVRVKMEQHIRDAFVVGYYYGKRMTVEEVLTLLTAR